MGLFQTLFTNVGLLELLCFIASIVFFAARLETATKMNKELISTEMQHVLQLMEVNHQTLKEDIQRLERKQAESNKVKERLAMQEVMMADLQALVHSHINSHEE